MSVLSQHLSEPRSYALSLLFMVSGLGFGCFGEPALPKVKKVVELPEQFEQRPTLEAKPLERWCL